jgi:hypothetical protein
VKTTGRHQQELRITVELKPQSPSVRGAIVVASELTAYFADDLLTEA